MGVQAEDGTAMAIGVATLSVNPRDNAVNLTALEGAMSTLVLCHLLHLMTNLVLIPPQLSHPAWTGMRRMKIGYESFICFPALYVPPNIPQSECNSQQLTLMGVSMYLNLECCWTWLSSWTVSGQHPLDPRQMIPSQETNMA